MNLKKILVIITSMLFLTISVNATNIAFSEKNNFQKTYFSNNVANWTVMYYMCCDSNMYEYGGPLLENLSKIGSSNDFNLVAMYDGIPLDDSKILYFESSGVRINLNEEIGWPSEVNYSNPIVFESFLKDMMKYFPAEHYILIIYGSAGTGWQKFCVHDECNTTDNILIKKGSIGFSTERVAEAFKKVTDDGKEKIDILYTSCAMHTIELAYEIHQYVDYMIGTQDCLSSDFIYRYYLSVWELSNNTSMRLEEFLNYSSHILKPKSFYYQDEYSEKGIKKINKIFNNLSNKKLQTIKHHDNIGVINNSNINELIKSVDNLSRYMIVNINDKNLLEDISYAREWSRESSKCCAKPGSILMYIIHSIYQFNFTAYSGVIDLYDFCEKLKEKTDNIVLKNYCHEVLKNINKTVPCITKVSTDPIHGLNIYFPREKDIYNLYLSYKKIPIIYENLAFSRGTAWDEFLKEYLNNI